MIVGGVIAIVLVVVVAFSVLKGGGSSPTATHSTPPAKAHAVTSRSVATNPAELAVTVLNGTETNGLAHHLAATLRQGGYSRAAASSSVPSGGAHQTTVVEYAPGHIADGRAVAKALNVTHVQPIEGSISALASSATVVVVAGADQAALFVPASQSNGEPAAGAEAGGGEAAGGGETPAGGSAEAPSGAAEPGTG
jgi:LytR cell envelope-related transcriptional attenuator